MTDDTQAGEFRKVIHGLAAAMLPQAAEHMHIYHAATMLLDVADIFTGVEAKVREIEAGLGELDEKAQADDYELTDVEEDLYQRLDGMYWQYSDLLDEVTAISTVNTAHAKETPNADH